MRMYQLTPIGKRAARATNLPDTNKTRVARWLDFAGRQTPEQIAENTGLTTGEVAGVLTQLKGDARHPAVVVPVEAADVNF